MQHATRSGIFCTVAFLLAITAPATARKETPTGTQATSRFVAAILDHALADLESRGLRLPQYDITVLSHLRDGHTGYLAWKKVAITDGIWVVEFTPREKIEGGSFTYFFREPDERPFEIWVGE